MLRSLVLLLAFGVAHAAKKSSSSPGEPLLALTDQTLQAALDEHPLMLLTIGVEGCEPCAVYERMIMAAGKEIRAQSKGRVALAKLTIESQDSPVIGNIVQGQMTLPKLLIFREGEAMDFDGQPTKQSIVEVMLREMSRTTILTLKSVKQTERFLHLDSWAQQHDEEKPPRVVGFFPSNTSAAYGVFKSTARKLQGMISFGEVFDPALQKKFLGKPPSKSVIQVVKADKKERTLTYSGPIAVPRIARWVATHSLSIVQDLTTESSIESHMARGVPVFLLLMPDEYEEELGSMMAVFRKVASRVRERLLFAYGFKDTEPWPQFAQQLGIDRSATGAFWMILGNNMEITGRNWSTAWLKPPSLGFQIYAMEARGGEQPEDVTEKKVDTFVSGFLKQVDAMMPPETLEGVVEEEEAPPELGGAGGGGGAGGEGGGGGKGGGGDGAEAAAAREKAANYDKELRKLIAAVEMSFNSGIANVKKVLDDVKDAPHLLPGKTAGLTSTVSTTELKVKKGLADVKRKLMDVGRVKKDEL